jgi:PQQ-like domain
VNNDERRLADVLHRITPEPPRPVTVEQVAYRLVSEPRLGRSSRGREPRPRRRGPVFSRALAPVLAAAAVVVVAGASAGIAVLANSHHHSSPPAGGAPATSASTSATASSSPSQTPSSTEQTTPTTRIAGGPWGAELIDHATFTSLDPVSADGSLYAFGSGTLDRIDPATGKIVATAPANPALQNPPVIIGNTVWVLWSYSGGNVILHAFDAQTLAPVKQILVPAVGAVSASGGSNVVTSGPDGHLYVAAGIAVVVVNPDNGQVLNRINLTAGTTDSVAISPDGSKMYVGVGGVRVLVYDLPSDTVVSSTKLSGTDSVGNLVATSGGVWGITGSGMSEWTWFAPNGDLSRAVRVGEGAGGGLDSGPSYSGGVVWVGGTGNVVCASPASGHVLASARVGSDHGRAVLVGSPALAGDHAYAFYVDPNDAQISGLIRMTPPAACSGLSS